MKEIEEIQQQIGMGVIWFPIEKVQFLLFHISTLKEKVKELKDQNEDTIKQLEEAAGKHLNNLTKLSEVEARIKEITDKWESLKFKVFDLEEKVKELQEELGEYKNCVRNANIILDGMNKKKEVEG